MTEATNETGVSDGGYAGDAGNRARSPWLAARTEAGRPKCKVDGLSWTGVKPLERAQCGVNYAAPHSDIHQEAAP